MAGPEPKHPPMMIRKQGGNGQNARMILIRGPITGALGRRVEIDTSPFSMFLDREQLTALIDDLIARRDDL